MRKSLLQLISDNEQDQADCDRWWAEASGVEKDAVWTLIQRLTRSDHSVIVQLIARFAQLSFGQAAERAVMREQQETK